MKKQPISITLLIAMLALLIGIVTVLFVNHDLLLALFEGADTETKQSALSVCIVVGVLFLLWLAALIWFARINHTEATTGRPDPLTGLSSKKQLRSNYENVSAAMRRFSCVAYIAYDDAKVRERYGTAWSENLQKNAADILRGALDEYDCAARLDDGEFALSLHTKDGLHAEQKVSEVIDKLIKYQYSILLEDISPFRAGLCMPDASTPFENALENAKVGYRYACDLREPTFICTQDILVKEESRKRLKEKLSAAIDAEEFSVFLQFIYNVKEKRFTGAEALSRWKSPGEGLLMPAYYIANMCSTGVIEKFDLYMLGKTCALLQEWNGTEFGDLTISCNITRNTISSVDFITCFRDILAKYQFNRRNLILEITEDALINNETVAYRNIMDCKAAGLRIAIDDFGVGHTAFNDIGDYPIDILKVDRQIVIKAATERGEALLQGLIDLSHQLNITVVCEGVETEKQVEFVVRNNTDYIQGYFYSYVFSVDEGKKFFLNSLESPVG